MVFHFFKKDIRRSAWLFSLWFLLFVLDGVFALSVPPPELNVTVGGFAWNPPLFPILRFLVLAVLVLQLIQEDAVTGSTAFWLTRPVSRGTLLLAKLAGLGLVVLIPVAVGSGVLLTFGVSSSDLGWAAVEILLRQLYFVVPIALLAALTSSFARFVATTVTLAIGLISASLRFVPIAESFANVELALTRYLVVAAVLIVGGGLLLTHQYLTRWGKRSIVLAICLLGVCILVDSFWSMNLVRAVPVRSSPAVFDVTTAAVRVTAGSLNNSPYGPSGSLGKNIDGYCALSGIPAEFLVQVRSVVPRLSTPDGMKIATLGVVSSVALYTFDPPATSAISAAIGDIPVYSDMVSSGSASITFATIDQATFVRYKDSPVKLVDNIDLVVSRYELAAEIPLVVGNRYDKGGVHVRITGLVPSEDEIAIVILDSCVSLRLGEAVHVSRQLADPRQKGEPIYLLVNRARKEAALVGAGAEFAWRTNFDGLIVRQRIKLPFTRKGNPRAPILDREWVAGAALVRLERVPVAEFSRTAEVELPKLGEPWRSVKATESKASSVTPEPLSKDQSNAGTSISISKSGVITLDGKAVTDEELKVLLVRTHAVDPNATVVIIADEGSEVNKTTSVMDAGRLAGLKKFRLQSR